MQAGQANSGKHGMVCAHFKIRHARKHGLGTATPAVPSRYHGCLVNVWFGQAHRLSQRACWQLWSSCQICSSAMATVSALCFSFLYLHTLLQYKQQRHLFGISQVAPSFPDALQWRVCENSLQSEVAQLTRDRDEAQKRCADLQRRQAQSQHETRRKVAHGVVHMHPKRLVLPKARGTMCLASKDYSSKHCQ